MSGWINNGQENKRVQPEPNDIHLLYARLEQVRDPSLTQRYHGMLQPGEDRALSRISSAKKREERLVSRALTRFALSRFLQRPPETIELDFTPHGKPELAPGMNLPRLRFNASHSGGVVACAVGAGAALGLDVEDTRRKVNLKLAGRFFSPWEAEMVAAAPDAEKKSLFLDFWTLKESFVKAKGKGLSYGLDRFGFDLAPEKAPRIRFLPGSPESPGNWTFFNFNLLDRYRLALAVESVVEEAPVVNIHECIPLETLRFRGRVLLGNREIET